MVATGFVSLDRVLGRILRLGSGRLRPERGDDLGMLLVRRLEFGRLGERADLRMQPGDLELEGRQARLHPLRLVTMSRADVCGAES